MQKLFNIERLKRTAKLGGQAYKDLYGNLGTLEGRRKGGLTTYNRYKNKQFAGLKLNLKSRKSIKTPPRSSLLAEYIGILLGDGNIGQYGSFISLSTKTDQEYALFVKTITKHLFGITTKYYVRKGKDCAVVAAHSIELVEYLIQNGLKFGNKVKIDADIPSWILEKDDYMISCLRGLIDTDGCIYLDKHKYKEKLYFHMGLNFHNHSKALVNSVFQIFNKLQFNPTQGIDAVVLRKQKQIIRYFSEVRSHNPKHRSRFTQYLGKTNNNGEVSEWLKEPVSKTGMVVRPS